MKKPAEKPARKKETATHEKLKTDYPLSEKDEVKQAERRTNKAAKKQ
jgi:hypothetical protein